MRRDNIIGYLLLAWCVIAAIVMLRALITGDGVSIEIPGWMKILLVSVFGGGMIWWLLFGRQSRWKP